MMFLPALTRSGKMPSLVKALTAKKMTVRGIYGEGSENSGYLYQISNKISLGYGEEEILRSVNAAAVRETRNAVRAETVSATSVLHRAVRMLKRQRLLLLRRQRHRQRTTLRLQRRANKHGDYSGFSQRTA